MSNENQTTRASELDRALCSAFFIGQAVSWRHVPRGGWGIPIFVPARILKINPKTIRIEAKRKDGRWETRNVKPESLFHYGQNAELKHGATSEHINQDG